MTTTVASGRRFTRSHACLVCGGHAALVRHKSTRCWGFLSSDGLYAHCARAERAGSIQQGPDGMYAHRLAGPCKCGVTHGAAPVPVPAERATDSADRVRWALRLWDNAADARGTVVEEYLWGRNVEIAESPVLRHAASLLHKPSDTAWPVMLARVELVGVPGLRGVHRTYLAPDGSGKAPVEPAKMMLGEFGRGEGVRLAPAASQMAVAEGIETALSVTALWGLPAWAGLSDGGVARLVLPPLPLASDVLIAADGDPAGRKAAWAATRRWRAEGRVVRLEEAPAGTDWNDVLREEVS